MKNPILIFDGTNTFIRNFAVNPHTDENGNDVGAIIGTLRSLKSMIRETETSRVFFVWDGEGGSRRRRGVFKEYKAGRKPRLNRNIDENSVKESKDNMDWQLAKTKQLLGYLGVTQIELDDIEADDAIGYLVGLLDPQPKVLVSSDRDFWQLVSPTTHIYWPTKKIFITDQNFAEQTSVLPNNFVLVRALTGKGDASDNIHGIKGLGEKTILKLFPEFAKKDFDVHDLATECRAIIEQQGPDPKGKFRWYKIILDNLELVIRNVQLMQLSSPNISTQSATIISEAAKREPQFNSFSMKMALLNLGLQITDADLLTTFKAYQVRTTSNEAR